MDAVELIEKKRDHHVLTKEEIKFIIENYVKGEIPDYQMSSLLMAIVLNGMTDEETVNLTIAMRDSGITLDLSHVNGVTADKHSTGGVGDKTSLILCPLVSAAGIKIAKMSGRGLGFTGGTLDKLESFNGFKAVIPDEEFINNVNEIGISIIGQSNDIDPADKMLYALRDVTGTVQSIPLIVSSIMSKKLASNAEIIVLDVKTGSGALMKTYDQSLMLAEKLVKIGKLAGKKTVAVITDMDEPLGYSVGNALEVKEAIKVLNGEDAGNVKELCLTLGSCILVEAGFAKNYEEASSILNMHLNDGSALNKLAEMVKKQGGNSEAVFNVDLLPKSKYQLQYVSDRDGYIDRIITDKIGLISMHLGGGRIKKDSVIDLSVGIEFKKKVYDKVNKGDVIAIVHANSLEQGQNAINELKTSIFISKNKKEQEPFIKKIIK